MKSLEIDMYPSDTQYEFITSNILENCIMGPRGEGKTEAGIMAMTFHASQQDASCRPIPWAIIRDTWTNLERTTLQSLLLPRPGSFAASIRNRLTTKDSGRYVELPGYWFAWLFGIDTLGDLNRLQSMQLGGLWIEEAAPAAEEDIGGGITEDAWTIGISSLRHPVTTNRRAQITQNYPDEDHWTWQRFHEENHNGDRALFRIARGENKHIDNQYRQNMAAALKARPDLYARLVEGRPYQVTVGEPVTPEYNPDKHRANNTLEPMKLTTWRCWDGGLYPACVFFQITPKGHCHILDTVQGMNTGMKQLIQHEIKPLIARRYSHITDWKDSGDPQVNEREQSDIVASKASDIINEELGTSFEKGVSDWTPRREAMKELLNRSVDGNPMLQVSKHDKIMHRVLNGGWHYHKDTSGRVLRDKPVKDRWSHPGDALSHVIAKIFEYKPVRRYKVPKKNLGKTYAVRTLYQNQPFS